MDVQALHREGGDARRVLPYGGLPSQNVRQTSQPTYRFMVTNTIFFTTNYLDMSNATGHDNQLSDIIILAYLRLKGLIPSVDKVENETEESKSLSNVLSLVLIHKY